MPEQIQGLRISPRGITHVQFDHDQSVARIREIVGCSMFTVVSLEQDIDLFVDDEALLRAEPELNLLLTVIAHALGNPQVLFGNGLAVSTDNETGETLPLTQTQKSGLLAAAHAKLDPEILEQLCDNLSFWPEAVELVRAHH